MRNPKQGAKLPNECFDVLKSSGELIRIKANESGYYRTDQEPAQSLCESKGVTMDELADELNKARDITKGQREAMSWGSVMGWDGKLADPKSYDEKGKIIKGLL
jgi:hypothetical protein|tara:strand:+ start:886 stop:1197 length:312 start_codon:yes stop_codon:yes gene_type:complete